MTTQTLYTIGHSILTWPVFIATLKAHGITHVADVRSMPGSNRQPQFNQERMRPALAAEGIAYSHHPDLGGRRSPRTITPELAALTAGWTHRSFRSYAAWTLTPAFSAGLAGLLQVAAQTPRLAFMCSEAVPWRCHRSILASALVAHGHDVQHIMDAAKIHPHTLGEWGATPARHPEHPEILVWPAKESALALTP